MHLSRSAWFRWSEGTNSLSFVEKSDIPHFQPVFPVVSRIFHRSLRAPQRKPPRDLSNRSWVQLWFQYLQVAHHSNSVCSRWWYLWFVYIWWVEFEARGYLLAPIGRTPLWPYCHQFRPTRFSVFGRHCWMKMPTLVWQTLIHSLIGRNGERSDVNYSAKTLSKREKKFISHFVCVISPTKISSNFTAENNLPNTQNRKFHNVNQNKD